MRSQGYNKYYSAVGIRVDEFDRMAADRERLRLIYPLVSMKPMTKKHINSFWRFQPFRLNLRGWEGNCKVCQGKDDLKLIRTAIESPESFDGFSHLEYLCDSGEVESSTKYIYRGSKKTGDYLEEAAKNPDLEIHDDHTDYSDDESCEIYSQCGVDN